jgi:catechol 2,3-dioxygenase-like lactoylglutathione lyase family enzyme
VSPTCTTASAAEGQSSLADVNGDAMVMQMKLEVVPVPVGDIDRAKAFYEDKLGFNVDHDVAPTYGVRVVQLTPEGSACSIILGRGLPLIAMEAGTIRGLHLVVADVNEARAAARGRGVDVADIEDMGGIKYAGFSDPDGNPGRFRNCHLADRRAGRSRAHPLRPR